LKRECREFEEGAGEDQELARDRCADDACLAAALTDDTVLRKHATIRGSVTEVTRET
jgi:hypothetical protein